LVLAISCSPLKILHTSALTIYQLQGNIWPVFNKNEIQQTFKLIHTKLMTKRPGKYICAHAVLWELTIKPKDPNWPWGQKICLV
jgi:hypothetical protein